MEKLGLSNSKGEEVIPPEYKKIRINKDNTISVLPFTEWLVLNGENTLSHKLQFDKVAPVAEGILKVNLGNFGGAF